ncbi:MAG: FkbM family methyltransferase [bacterium]
MLNKLKRKLEIEFKIITGRLTRIKKSIVCSYEWYGSKHGGFYVHHEHLNKDSIVYSFGLGEDISFDKTVIEKHGCNVFGFDPTPKSINWLKNQQLPDNFTLLEYGLDSTTGFRNFNLPKNDQFVSGSIIKHINVDENNIVSVPMKSFIDITTELNHKHIDLLKMDIEGTEFDIFDSIFSSEVEIQQILIEIHERFFEDGKNKTLRLLALLKRNGYKIFGVSDSMQEISFIKM